VDSHRGFDKYGQQPHLKISCLLPSPATLPLVQQRIQELESDVNLYPDLTHVQEGIVDMTEFFQAGAATGKEEASTVAGAIGDRTGPLVSPLTADLRGIVEPTREKTRSPSSSPRLLLCPPLLPPGPSSTAPGEQEDTGS
jgi:hypothetical protein